MKIVFVTTQSVVQSTLVGRIMPVAKEIQNMGNDVTVLVHEEMTTLPLGRGMEGVGATSEQQTSPHISPIGKNPFTRTAEGKKRVRGFSLALLMLGNAFRSTRELIRLKPDVIVIVKPLPENVLAVSVAHLILRKTRIVLDADDFELFANVVSSIPERAVLHWAERRACAMAHHIITATPFLADHMRAICQKSISITLIPTGLTAIVPLAMVGKAGFNPVITYIGSITASSGHLVFMLPDILERVRKEFPNAEMLIVGSGDDEQELKQKFADKNLADSVSWFGRFSDVDMPEIISSTSVLVDPIDDSIVNRAKSSFRAMTAVTYGVPIVTSNIGIRAEIIPQQFQHSFFATPADIPSYSHKIADLLSHPIDADQVEVLQETGKQYSFQAMAIAYYNCLT